jgi:hypothetical protein|tara:strand:- start:556 stop:1014 length:459 start_codon:yes stop_codon:yes gene_type:complete
MDNLQLNQFFATYNDALKSYDDNRTDFITINLMHHKFVKDNKVTDKKIIDAKLSKLINLYINQVNIKFSKKIYSKCGYIWENAGLFIENNLWLCIESIESNNSEESYQQVCVYYKNIESVIELLSLQNIIVFNKPISEILKKIKSQIEKMRD